MTVRYVVMAHPKRTEWANRLGDVLDCPVVWDRGHGVWDTGRRALLAVRADRGWGVVVQDDAVLTRNFTAKAEKFLNAHDRHNGPVAFYAGARARKWTRRPAVRQRGFWAAPGPTWGVAVATPAAMIGGMVEWCDQLTITNYDLRMREYWQHQGVSCVYSAPSLVNHRPVTENPSLADERRTANRLAAWFVP